MFCSNCGEYLDDDALFCINCGKKVYDEQANYEKNLEKTDVFESYEKKEASEKLVKKNFNQNETRKIDKYKTGGLCKFASKILIIGIVLLAMVTVLFLFSHKRTDSHWVSSNILSIDGLEISEASSSSHFDTWYALTKKDWEKIQNQFPQQLMFYNKIWYLYQPETSFDYEEENNEIFQESDSNSVDLSPNEFDFTDADLDMWYQELDFENPDDSEFILDTEKEIYACGITNWGDYYLSVIFSSSKYSSGPLIYLAENLPAEY